MKSIITLLKKISKSFFEKYKDQISDIILFGSLMRGKTDYKDIDILIIFKKKIDKDTEYELKKSLLSLEKNISLISKTEQNYKDPSFDGREGVLFEGYNLLKSRHIASDFGFASFGLFLYDTSKLSNAMKTRFYYALNGRKSSGGAVGSLGGIKLSDNTLAVPLDRIEPAKEFFDYWKLEYKYVPSLFPERLGRKTILEKVR